jgi:hypothetical protein
MSLIIQKKKAANDLIIRCVNIKTAVLYSMTGGSRWVVGWPNQK